MKAPSAAKAAAATTKPEAVGPRSFETAVRNYVPPSRASAPITDGHESSSIAYGSAGLKTLLDKSHEDAPPCPRFSVSGELATRIAVPAASQKATSATEPANDIDKSSEICSEWNSVVSRRYVTHKKARYVLYPRCGPVVQLDRASEFDSEGCRFEPCRDRHAVHARQTLATAGT